MEIPLNPSLDNLSTPRLMLASLQRNRQLIWQMMKREVTSRYRGSIMGLAWSFINPFIMLAVYTFVFSVVFKARWNIGGEENRVDFAITLFVGMIVFNLFAEVVNRAPGLIVSNVNFVKRVLFPLEILPWVVTGSALFHSLISLLVLLITQFAVKQFLPWTVIVFPLVLLPLILVCVGLGWFLASLGVYVRDVGQVTSVFTTILMFLSAVFYPITALPEIYQPWVQLNPLAYIINESRNVLIYGKLPAWDMLGIVFLFGLFVALAGFWWFQKTRKGFADVI
jgi:lipopolysaccharide transport system permease protein